MDINPTYREKVGLWFPANEPRWQKSYDGLMKYMGDMDFLISLIPPKRRLGGTCVQAGGHIGLWPLKLSKYFGQVVTFEPDPIVYPALARNTSFTPNISVAQAALGAKGGMAQFSYYSGRSAVSTMAEIKDEGDLHAEVGVVALDDLKIKYLAALVLDVEGYEPQVLEGARKTIARCHPVIMCELLPKSKQAIEDTLASMGYVRHPNPAHRKDRDGVFVWKS